MPQHWTPPQIQNESSLPTKQHSFVSGSMAWHIQHVKWGQVVGGSNPLTPTFKLWISLPRLACTWRTCEPFPISSPSFGDRSKKPCLRFLGASSLRNPRFATVGELIEYLTSGGKLARGSTEKENSKKRNSSWDFRHNRGDMSNLQVCELIA